MMRRMADETGEDLGPEFGEVVNRLEKGEDPDAIEKSMPELAEMGATRADGGLWVTICVGAIETAGQIPPPSLIPSVASSHLARTSA
jgi:hypothetical protein